MKLEILSRDKTKKNIRTIKEFKICNILSDDINNFLTSELDIYDINQIGNNKLKIVMYKNDYDINKFINEFKKAYKQIFSYGGLGELFKDIEIRYNNCKYYNYDNTYNKKELDHIFDLRNNLILKRNYQIEYINQ